MRPLRRHFLQAAIGGVLAAPVSAWTQTRRVARVGYVDNTIPLAELSDPARRDPNTRAFVEALRERGWAEGKNLEILWRSAEGTYERRPTLLGELVRRAVDVIVVFGDLATRDARAQTRTIPIVMVSSHNPFLDGHVASLARPGGNVTGLISQVDGIFGKRLELLRETAPHVRKVGTFRNDALPPESVAWVTEVAQSVGVKWAPIVFSDARAFERSFEDAVRDGVNGMLFGALSFFSDARNHGLVRNLVERHRVAALDFATSGQLGAVLHYGPDPQASHVSAAGYVDRILRGAKAADLPIEQPRLLTLWVNKRAAKAIGLVVPRSILARADRVIE